MTVIITRQLEEQPTCIHQTTITSLRAFDVENKTRMIRPFYLCKNEVVILKKRSQAGCCCDRLSYTHVYTISLSIAQLGTKSVLIERKNKNERFKNNMCLRDKSLCFKFFFLNEMYMNFTVALKRILNESTFPAIKGSQLHL